MLPLNLKISGFGNLSRISETLDDAKELFNGVLIAGYSRKNSIFLTRLQFCPILPKFYRVPSHCLAVQAHLKIFSLNFLF